MKQATKNNNLEDTKDDLDYAAIGSRIKAQRKKLGMTQATLAEKVEISNTHMSHIESGNTKLSLATFVRLTETLTVTADTLLFPAPKDESGSIISGITKILGSCNVKELSIIRDMVESTVSSLKKNN
ncbi:MAG: helix-turn-helix transcriptional regulator [Lachnospiraceae bacterium]|nr:helix-turn-helix transcriptional regulator [Lachnospiraceae bacterium]